MPGANNYNCFDIKTTSKQIKMILTVGNTKGGVGKTSLTLNLAISQLLAGRKVWLIDGDRQGTASIAISIRSQSPALPALQCDKLPDGKELRAQLSSRGKQFDDVVIDAGGRDSSALRAALVLSDAVLIPFAPRSLDLWALTDMSQLVSEAQAINPQLRALAVLSMADTTGRDNQEAIDALQDFPLLTYVPAPILRRKSVANASGLGLSVLEHKPKDLKAITELQCLSNMVLISK